MKSLTLGFLALVFTFSAAATIEPYSMIPVRIKKIVDGDTVHVEITKRTHYEAILKVLKENDRGRPKAIWKAPKFAKTWTLSVRMLNHDTPESTLFFNNKKYAQESFAAGDSPINWGEEAKKVLKTLLKKGQFAYAKIGAAATGKYGRLLAEIIVPNGPERTNVNLRMVELGWSFPFLFPPLPPKEDVDDYVRAMVTAREGNKGLWKNVTFSAATSEFGPPATEFPTNFRTRVTGKNDVKYVGSLENLFNGSGKPLKAYPYECRDKISPEFWFFFNEAEALEKDSNYRFELESGCPETDE